MIYIARQQKKQRDLNRNETIQSLNFAEDIEQVVQLDQPIQELLKKHEQGNNLTELENVIVKLSTSKYIIEKAVVIILNKELKQQLKDSIKNIKEALNIIINNENLYAYNIIKKFQKQITKNDIDFIESHFQDPTKNLSKIKSLNNVQRNNVKSSTLLMKRAIFTHRFVQLIPNLTNTLHQAGHEWNFDMLFLDKITNQQALYTVANYLFKSILSVESVYNIQANTYEKFFESMQSKYLNNPYHNSIHAADVSCSCLFLVLNSNLKSSLDNIDNLATVIACIGHDIGHPALNNRFLVNSLSDLAITYNDSSILENMHCASTFKELYKAEQNFISNMDQDQQTYIRKVVIEMILETDMSKHFEALGKFHSKALSMRETFDLNVLENRTLILKTALKCADIGHASKD